MLNTKLSVKCPENISYFMVRAKQAHYSTDSRPSSEIVSGGGLVIYATSRLLVFRCTCNECISRQNINSEKELKTLINTPI